MKKTVIALAAAAMTAPLAANAETSWFGFSQITAAAEDGDNNDGLKFGADRVRIGYKASEGDAFAKLQMDFNQSGTNGLPNQIKDAVVGYKLSPAAKITTGQFKTPVGMDFTGSGKKLDITKRGMEKGLAMERAAGAMLSGDFEGGFGYDVGVFNPPTRSKAVSTETGTDADGNAGGAGEDMTMAGRLRYDMDNLHLQLGYGTVPNAGGNNSEDPEEAYNFDTSEMEEIAGSGSDGNQDTEDYTVMNFGAKYTMDPLTLKFEYMDGENVLGDDDLDQNVMYVHGGFMLNDSTELVARHYTGNLDDGNDDMDVTNTYLGANFFLNDAARVQVNYVVAGGDNEDYADYSGDSAFGKTYTDDALLAQFQYSF